MGRPSTARKRLLQTALREFSRAGAQAVGVDELCRLAGINKGSFYHFFPSKADLLQACLETQWDRLRVEVFEPAFAPDRPARERVREFFDRILQRQEREFDESGVYCGCLFCSLGNEIGVHDAQIRSTVADFMNRNLAFLTGAFSEALGETDRSAQAPILAETTYCLLLGGLVESRIRQDLGPLRRAREAALTLFEAIPAPTPVASPSGPGV